MLSDTHPDAQRVQIELLRRMTPEERLRMAFGSDRHDGQSVASGDCGVKSRSWTTGVNLKCVELYYGKELASRLRDLPAKAMRSMTCRHLMPSRRLLRL